MSSSTDKPPPTAVLSAHPSAPEFERLTPTTGLEEAAKLLRVSRDCLLRKARAGIVPGAKIGRSWVFVSADLIELIRQKARERVPVPLHRLPRYFGESATASAVIRKLDARLAALKRKGRPT